MADAISPSLFNMSLAKRGPSTRDIMLSQTPQASYKPDPSRVGSHTVRREKLVLTSLNNNTGSAGEKLLDQEADDVANGQSLDGPARSIRNGRPSVNSTQLFHPERKLKPIKRIETSLDARERLKHSYEDVSAAYTYNSPKSPINPAPMDLSKVSPHVLSSKRIFPIDLNDAIQSISARKTSVPVHVPTAKITLLEDSSVSVKPPRIESRSRKRYARNSALISIANVNADDREQKRKINELLLSHVDTLTRSGLSRTVLPQISTKRVPSPSGSSPSSPPSAHENPKVLAQIDKYLSPRPLKVKEKQAKQVSAERIKFLDFDTS